MDVTEAIAARRSVRGFLDTPVDPTLLHELAVKASRAATGGNLQPWHIAIVHGEPMARLKAIMAEKIATGATETPA
jgi:nitroreductase